MQNAAIEDEVDPESLAEVEKTANQWAYEAHKQVCPLQSSLVTQTDITWAH